MRLRRPRNLILPIIALLAAVIVGRFDRPAAPPADQVELPSGTFSGKVVGVSDGDTIRVLYKSNEVKVRLWGVDCPEKDQAYGTAAKNFTSDMVFGKEVTVDARDKDRYGRVVGWVKMPDGKVLNAELVRAGLAWWYRDYAPRESELQDLEAQARAARRGLWADKSPTAPWTFRKEERALKGQ